MVCRGIRVVARQRSNRLLEQRQGLNWGLFIMRPYVTTSWDDGGVFDLKLAELLRGYGVAGTLYWTVDFDRFPLPSPKDAEEILSLGMEIGSHTMTHPDLTAIDDEALRWELSESKVRLEALTGSEISSFCYPFGYFNRRASEAVDAAGYLLGRTTVGFRKDLGSDPFQMPVSIQLYPHGRRVHVTHALKERNGIGLGRWLTAYKADSDLVSLAATALDEIRRTGGVLHLWGHSWELEEFDLWERVEVILETVAQHDDVAYVTNGQLMAAAGADG